MNTFIILNLTAAAHGLSRCMLAGTYYLVYTIERV